MLYNNISTIKHTLTTLCLLAYLTVSAQVIDRFPHIEEFNNSSSFTWNAICLSASCPTFAGERQWSLIGSGASAYIQSHDYDTNSPNFIVKSPIYDLSCIEAAEIQFDYQLTTSNELILEYRTGQGAWTNVGWNAVVANSWVTENIDLSAVLGNATVQLRFVADQESQLDNIKVGAPGNTITLSYNYDLAGNRIGASLVVSLQNEEIVEARNNDESGSDSKFLDPNNFRVYPNPSKETVFLETDLPEMHQITLVSPQGNVIKKMSLDGNTKLDFSELIPGTYYVKIATEEKSLTYKIVKI